MSATSSAPAALHVPAQVTPELQLEIERFLYAEAAMLDRGDIAGWYEVLADDIRYLMPVGSNHLAGAGAPKEFTPEKQAAFFDETKASMRQRVKRLQSGMAWAEMPASRTRHLVTNVLIEPTAVDGEYRVESCFLVYRSRLERQVDLFAGSRDDLLRRTVRGVGWEIARRTIHLDQATLLANNLSIFF
jgi:3-phenylpropionate/cinnamic acid dioxygenase small subunit